MSSKVVLLVLLSVAISNGSPSANIPEVETPNNKEEPIVPKAGPAWLPMNPIVESATETPPSSSSAAPITPSPGPFTTEAPIEAITAGEVVDDLAPIAGETHRFERVMPVAAGESVSGESTSKALGDEEVAVPVMVAGSESDPVMQAGGCSSPVLRLGTLGTMVVIWTMHIVMSYY